MLMLDDVVTVTDEQTIFLLLLHFIALNGVLIEQTDVPPVKVISTFPITYLKTMLFLLIIWFAIPFISRIGSYRSFCCILKVRIHITNTQIYGDSKFPMQPASTC